MTLSPLDGCPVAGTHLTRDHLDPDNDGWEAFWPLSHKDNGILGDLSPVERLAAIEAWPAHSDPIVVGTRTHMVAKLKYLIDAV